MQNGARGYERPGSVPSFSRTSEENAGDTCGITEYTILIHIGISALRTRSSVSCTSPEDHTTRFRIGNSGGPGQGVLHVS